MLIMFTGTNQKFPAVYGVGQQYEGALIRDTQTILHNLAELSHDLNVFLDTHFGGAISRASKMAVRLMLAHHHVRTPDILT